MNSRLKQIANWPELAQLHRYCVRALADHVGCSRRQLGRYVRRTQRQSPAAWLNGLRQRHALELLRAHHRVTAVGRALHYKTTAHFSRAFKKFYGVPPSEWTLILPLSQKVPNRIQMSQIDKSPERLAVPNSWNQAETGVTTWTYGASVSQKVP